MTELISSKELAERVRIATGALLRVWPDSDSAYNGMIDYFAALYPNDARDAHEQWALTFFIAEFGNRRLPYGGPALCRFAVGDHVRCVERGFPWSGADGHITKIHPQYDLVDVDFGAERFHVRYLERIPEVAA